MIDILNLGAGVQSTTVLLMSLAGELPPLDHVVFADTGWEPKEVYTNLEWLKTLSDITVVSAGNIRDDHVDPQTKRDGMRSTIPFYVDTGKDREGKTFRKCTSEYKIAPIDAWIRSHVLGLKKGERSPKNVVRRWYGISFDELQRMRSPRNRWEHSNYYPLVDMRMTRCGCLEWCRKRGYPEPPESACIGCPFRTNASWRGMKLHSLEDFTDAAEFDTACRNHAVLSGTAYLHRSLVPLGEIDFRNDVDKGQQLLWQDECEGMCGL